jgi:hypothetical protein
VDLLVEFNINKKGFVRQEQASLPQFLGNRFGSFYG